MRDKDKEEEGERGRGSTALLFPLVSFRLFFSVPSKGTGEGVLSHILLLFPVLYRSLSHSSQCSLLLSFSFSVDLTSSLPPHLIPSMHVLLLLSECLQLQRSLLHALRLLRVNMIQVLSVGGLASCSTERVDNQDVNKEM